MTAPAAAACDARAPELLFVDDEEIDRGATAAAEGFCCRYFMEVLLLRCTHRRRDCIVVAVSFVPAFIVVVLLSNVGQKR